MKIREALAWVASVTLAFGWWWSAHGHAEATEQVTKCAGELYGCAERLSERDELCSETSAAAMQHAVQIFQCEVDVCEVNGWHPPIEWDEIQQEMLADPEFQARLNDE